MTRENIRPVAQAFGLLAAALLVLSILYGLFAWQAVQRERLGEVAGVATAGARAAAHLLQSEQQRFAMLTDELGEAGGPAQPDAATRVLQRVATMRPGLGRIDLLDAAGRSVAATEPWPPTAATARETALLAGLAQAREHEGLQLGPVAWRSADQTWLPVTQRLVDAASGRTYGFVVAQLRIDGAASWHHLQTPAHVHAGLVSDTGETLIQLAGPVDETARGPFWKWLRDHDRPRQGSVAIGDTFDVDLRHYAFERVDGHRITAFASVSQAALLRGWFDRVRVPFLVFALALAGLAFATAWTHRQQRQRETEQDAAAATLREQDGELRRQTALLSQTQRAAHVGGWELDPASGRLYWTEETYRIHEVLADEFTPTVDAAIAFYTSESRELVRAALDKALRTGQSWDLELQLVTARGRPLWVRATGVAELGPRGVCAKVFGALQDVTERHRADERIRRLAHYDELTGLANRNLFTYHLGHVLSRAERYTKQLAVLFIDLDRFKIINDTLGHDTGDRVLETIARRLSEQMRASDLVARLSGDEFMVVVEEIEGPGVVEDVARKLLRAIEEPVQHQGQEFSLSGSIGIAVYPQDGRDQQSLLKHADIAMYRAKDQGKNGFEFYSSGMNAASVERFSLESKLKRAVVDQNQFVLHYQPKVSVADGRIVGAEALVRWVSPDRGLIPPGEFIPLAEETGLIGAIGEWVLTNACRQAAAWAAKGLPTVRVAVNLSARQLYSPGFLATVRQALADSGVNPGGMELEITESVMMHHVEQVAEVLGELKVLGVHIAVDDFGTGYSSLAYLKRLPLDSLKVDRSFVRDVPGDPDDEAITRAVVALAHSLRLKVVAEGVETEEQLGFLCELGCDEIQGFLFSRPVPAAEFEELLRRDARLPRPAGQTRAA